MDANQRLQVEALKAAEKRLRVTLERQEGAIAQTRAQLAGVEKSIEMLSGQPPLPMAPAAPKR